MGCFVFLFQSPVSVDMENDFDYVMHNSIGEKRMKKRQRIRKALILISFFLFPVIFYYLSPALIIEATAENIINGSFIMFGLLFLASLFLGRLFCAWICPAGGVQEACSLANDKKIRKGNWIKWMIWIPWMSVIILLAVTGGGYKRLDPLYQTWHGISISEPGQFIVYFFVLFLIVGPAFLIGRRSFCHHLCWAAPFMIAGRKIRNFIRWPALQLAADKDRCRHCHTCTENCPMSLDVERMVELNEMEKAECILCATCIDNCPEGVIAYKFSRP